MSKLTDFIGQLTSGLARSNRYTVEMTLPQILNVHPSDQQKVALLCESVNIPGLNVNTVQIRTFGEVREMPTEFNYDPITLTFYVDGDMIVKDVFDKWIKSVQNSPWNLSFIWNCFDVPAVSGEFFVLRLPRPKTNSIFVLVLKNILSESNFEYLKLVFV